MFSFETEAADALTWRLLYTKSHAEAWVDANLRKQGFAALLPRVSARSGLAPLFPRYVFAGFGPGQNPDALTGTYGVQYVVHCGATPARVPASVIVEIRERMDERGIVRLDKAANTDPMFAKRQRERVYALARLAEVGFKVRLMGT